MQFHQLKTLLWRNLILKRRAWVSTLLEMLIPTLIILIIAYNSKYDSYEYSVEDREYLSSSIIDDYDSIHGYYENQFEINFVFPKNFEKQDIFLENFKNCNYFKNFTILREDQNFTYPSDYFSEYSYEYYENNKLTELKINVHQNELDMYNNKYKEPHNYDKYIYVKVFGVIFKSLTDYTLYFNAYNELYESLKNNDYISSEFYQAPMIQLIIDKAIIKTLEGTSDVKEIEVRQREMDTKGYHEQIEENNVQEYIPLFMIFYFVPCICSLLNHLVIEKESKIKESLVIIGLKRSNFWLSWGITYGIIIFISTILIIIFMYIYNLFIYVKWAVPFLILIIYGMSCCCLSFLMSTLIKKSKTASTMGVLIIIGFFVTYFIEMSVDSSVVRTILIYTISPISFLSVFNYIIKLEGQRLSVSLMTVLKNKTMRGDFFGLLFTLILYFTVSVYLDNVLPQGNNFHRKWNFFITDLFSKKNNNNNNNDNIKTDYKNDNPYIEKDPEGKRKAVQVKNIAKSFKVKGENIEILKNIDFNAYYDEIFAILGHNGAGKTTLISIMTGIISSTRGNVYYDDVPIIGNETEVCKQFGYCPQFDTFNNNLTVEEHVKLFAGIKNVKVDVEKILKDIELLNKKKNFPKQLSGGQRRKLCITLALLGSPKYVFLDEPTTGLDPYSRKTIWELLSKMKKDRVMFVTTHYMDEADLLADRKMITSNGYITCLGSSLFLKNSFNMNYSLDIHTKDMNDSSLTDEIMEKYCPGSSKNKTIGNTNMDVHTENENDNNSSNIIEDYIITYLLPMKYSQSFKDIFEQLNELIKVDTNKIENFSLTAPTLEELFIKLENNDGSVKDINNIQGSAHINMETENKNLVESLNPIFNKTNLNKASSWNQIWSITKLRLKIFVRNKTFAILYTLLPVILIIVAIYFENKYINSMTEMKKYKPLEVNQYLYDDLDTFIDTKTATGDALKVLNSLESTSKLKFKKVDYENELTVKSGKLTTKENYIYGFSGLVKEEDQGLQFTIYTNYTYDFALPISINLLSNALLDTKNIDKKIKVTYKPFDQYEDEEYDEDDTDNLFNLSGESIREFLEPILIVAMAMTMGLSISIYGPLTVKEREDGITHQLFLNGTKRINYWMGILLGDAICILVPVSVIGIVAVFNNIGIFNPKVILYTIIVTLLWTFSSLLHQYILSYFFNKYEKVSTLFVILNPILTLLVGVYALVAALINDFDVDEENANNKKIDIKFYVILFLYSPAIIVLLYTKASTFIVMRKLDISREDITSFTQLPEVIEILNNNDLTKDERSKKLTKLFFDKKMPSLSDLFKSSDKFLYLILGVVILIAIYSCILYFLDKSKQKIVKRNSEYPEERRALLDKKLKEGPRDVYNEWNRVKQALDSNNPLSKKIALKIFQINKDFFLGIADLRKILTRSNDSEDGSNNNNNNSDNNENNKNKKKLTNKDIEKGAFEKMDNRIIHDKNSHTYVNRIVDDVTFGVNVGECLGLLGPNGAGKTTSISMITGLLSHTHGKIIYGNKDLSSTETGDLSLGYCAQFDSLWKLLTVKETVEFYLNICGYPKSDIPRYTKALIEACGIELHTYKRVSEISGGTKRKLSLIIAICSSPSYLILDEPSAGMDPFTRRYMWKLITELKKVRETATILTTHSTEEAEALCDRIAILIKGRLVCVDTPRSIKMNHTTSYTLEVFTDRPEEFEKSYVKEQNLFGLDSSEDYILENSMNYQKYSVKMKTENISNVFALMENAKMNGLITQYNFGQYSLEQVFINFINNVE